MYWIGIRLLASAVIALAALSAPAFSHTSPAVQHEALTAKLQSRHAEDEQSVYIHRGLVNLYQQDFEHALADLKKAETLGPEINVAYALGLLYFRQQNAEKALNYFTNYLAVFSNHVPSLEYRAKSLMELGNTAQAIAAYRQYIAHLSYPAVDDYLYLSRLYGALALSTEGVGSADPDQVVDVRLAALDEGMHVLGVNPSLQIEAISLLRLRQRFSEALVRHDSLSEILSTTPRWLITKGDLLKKLEKKTEAKNYYRMACERLQLLKSTPARLHQRKIVSSYC